MERKQTEEAIRELRERFSKQIARELVQWEKLLPLPIKPSDVPIYLEYLDVDRVLFQLPKESSAIPHTEHFGEDPKKIIETTIQAKGEK